MPLQPVLQLCFFLNKKGSPPTSLGRTDPRGRRAVDAPPPPLGRPVWAAFHQVSGLIPLRESQQHDEIDEVGAATSPTSQRWRLRLGEASAPGSSPWVCGWAECGQLWGAGRPAERWTLPAGGPLVSMPPRIHGYLHQPLLVSCSVHSALPFRLQLRRHGARLGEERHLQ